MPGQERILICLVVVVIISASIGTWLYRTRNKLPDTIRIASGTEGGEYNNFGDSLGKKLSVRTGRTVKNIETDGTLENLKLLKQGVVEVALLQSIMFPDPENKTSNGVSVIAPLFLEPVVILTQKESAIQSVYDLENRPVCTGPEEPDIFRIKDRARGDRSVTEVDKDLSVADATGKTADPPCDMFQVVHIKGLTQHVAQRAGRIVEIIRPFRGNLVDCGVIQFFL
ncbi:MAG: hypothetical protein D3910_20975 [Candidatus Electrothrix sp. ATG2]|nr:hypothetical protein [Candidatus Electrothrix sp. ATG2]